jgi:hypothetical protein
MNIALRKPWTQERFFAWAQVQNLRYEFDGTQPVAMTGGNAGHSVVIRGLHRSLDARLRRGPCQPLGPDAGLETVNKAVRYPDALVTCSKFELTSGDMLRMPEIGIEIPVSEFYEDMTFPDQQTASA